LRNEAPVIIHEKIENIEKKSVKIPERKDYDMIFLFSLPKS